MAEKHTCPCYRCCSGKDLTRKSIRSHFRANAEHLEQLRNSGANKDFVDFVQDCHDQMIVLIDSFNEGAHSSGQSRSPYPSGECSYDFQDDFNYLLICLDLADAPMASPPFLEEELSVNDPMNVDGDCE